MLRMILSNLLFFTLLLPHFSYADTGDNPAAQYQAMIEKAHSTPPQLAPPPPNSTVSSGQAALIPAPMHTMQNTPTATSQNNPAALLQNNTIPNTANQTASQQAAPAGPPNIFITPNSNTASKQGNSVIHY